MLIEVDNPDWDEDPLRLQGWEPWEEYEEDEPVRDTTSCEYCGNTEVRPDPDPFGGKLCCDRCFLLLIGDDVSDEPWRCGGAVDGLVPSGRHYGDGSRDSTDDADGDPRVGLRHEG